MPNRSDKRDALTLSGYLSGIEFEFVDGVNGSLMSERAYPAVYYESKQYKKNLCLIEVELE